MAGKRFQGEHGCCRDRADGSCALATVGRLSEERVRELAEDIAAYRRRRQQEREAWRPGWPRRAGIVAVAAGGVGLLTRALEVLLPAA